MIATSPELTQSMRTVTDESDQFRLSCLPPGTYRVVFRSPGSPEVERDHVTVHAGRITPVFVKLQPPPAPEEPEPTGVLVSGATLDAAAGG